jgi:hypothetical protein
LTPGMPAPLESTTAPLIVPLVSWPQTAMVINIATTATRQDFMSSSFD